MKVLDLFTLAAAALTSHRRRTGFSLLGVGIGVAAVLVLTALGEGARIYVGQQFESLGTNNLIILPGRTETAGGMPGFSGVPNDLTLEDARALQRGLRSSQNVVPVSLGNDTVESGARSRQVIVLGSVPEILEVRRLAVRSGSFLPESPWDRGAQVAVLGSKLAKELFPTRSAVGEVVRIGGRRTRVLGVLESRGVQLGVDMDETVFVPVATCMRMFNRSSLFRVVCEIRAHADMGAARARAKAILLERHGEEDFTLITQDAVLGALGKILGALTLALAGIAAISLSVAGIGIMNVMLVSVSERTAEIGLLKAVGSAPRQILSLFLAEAVLLSLAGGVLGLGLGWALVRGLVTLYPAFPATPPPWAIAAALGVSSVVGVFFGVLPARRAMRMDPVDALTGRGR